MHWDGPILTDSGGYQVFSLARLRKIDREGVTFQSHLDGSKHLLTPEKAMKIQESLGSDIMMCLDECTSYPATHREAERSLALSTDWARRCKESCNTNRAALFGIVQGGMFKDLRAQGVEALTQIGFDGYAYGGWPVDQQGHLVEAVEITAGWVPRHLPLHGLGIGKPESIVRAARLGFNLFDCVLPSRDARHNRLVVFKDKPGSIDLREKDFYQFLYFQDNKHVRDTKPVEEHCDCLCCRNYSRSYLHHLLKIEDPLVYRLATIHNLRFYSRLLERLQSSGVQNR